MVRPASEESKAREAEANAKPRTLAAQLWDICVGLLVTLALFGVAEAATRIHHNYAWGGLPSYNPRHLVDFSRFYRINPTYRTTYVRVNAQGFRNDEEITREKPDGVLRVVTMGGSTVWGEAAGPPFGPLFITNEQTIAANLEEILNKRSAARGGPRVQVINAGVVGYRLYQNETYFAQRIAGFEPDLVIAMDGHNDLDALQLQTGPYYHRNQFGFDRAANDPTLIDALSPLGRYVADRSLFVRKAYYRFRDWGNARALRDDGYIDRFKRVPDSDELDVFLDQYEATVRRFDAATRIAGSRVMFALQTEAAGEQHKVFSPEEETIREYYSYYEYLHTEIRDLLIERMLRLRDEQGIWFVDVTDTFAGDAEWVYLDYTHLTGHGARVMAERLADEVEEVLFASPEGISTLR